MSTRSDIIVNRPYGGTIAIVETRNRIELTRSVASQIRKNMIDLGFLSDVRYFFMLSQDYGYLWEKSWLLPDGAPPTLEFSMKGVIARYFSELGESERIRAETFQLLISQWFTDMSHGRYGSDWEPENSLIATGFLDAIRDAEIVDGLVYDRLY